jgi:hypothetical protein
MLSPAGARAEVAAQSDGWSIDIVARAGPFHDRGVIIGASSTPRTEPHPPLGPGVDVFVGDRTASGSSLDLRPGPLTRENWDVVVTTGLADTEIELIWPDLSSLPKELAAYLVDETVGKRIYMRTTRSYALRSAGDGCVRPLRIEVTERSGVAPMASVTAQAAGTGRAEIAVTLSAEGVVDVTVINIAGRPVARVAADELLPSGMTRLLWDGRNAAGTRVPAGSYLVRVIATGEDGQRASAIASIQLGR